MVNVREVEAGRRLLTRRDFGGDEVYKMKDRCCFEQNHTS